MKRVYWLWTDYFIADNPKRKILKSDTHSQYDLIIIFSSSDKKWTKYYFNESFSIQDCGIAIVMIMIWKFLPVKEVGNTQTGMFLV